MLQPSSIINKGFCHAMVPVCPESNRAESSGRVLHGKAFAILVVVFVCQLHTNGVWRQQGGWFGEAYNFISRPTHNEDACRFALAATAALLATPPKCKQPSKNAGVWQEASWLLPATHARRMLCTMCSHITHHRPAPREQEQQHTTNVEVAIIGCPAAYFGIVGLYFRCKY